MKEIEVSINSPIFAEFNENLNEKLLSCMQELYAENFSGGEISAKISIEIVDDCEFYPSTDEHGEITEKAYHFQKPVIEHKITLTLKKRDEVKGVYNEQLELKRDNERFILTEVKKAQLSLLDTEG